MENPIKMDDLGATPIFGNTYLVVKTQAVPTFYFNQSHGCVRYNQIGFLEDFVFFFEVKVSNKNTPRWR